ncbi:TIGR02677 family protein [Fodinisporobacter ferrooxydans]|uniref:TIGR02677 family protein n=1 Tax=Fodinisporobacter ferrooxydans TaxID=2901836 RepID=A0ABY4CLA0_9BACL|nr:TIGR02677 family protein [Alicyclobacillaceae bacterium MYW30-H2]
MNRKQVKELWTKPVPETKYLNADNVARYRLILRYFYENHSKLKYWLKVEEVHEGVMNWELLSGYTLEQCQRDLEVLTEWKNLNSRHDGGRATTIEEYLRKRYRYQITPYTIEIERMLESLENIQGYGGSLEPTLLERLSGYVRQIRDTDDWKDGEALLLWNDLQLAFRQLHENASDYLASLQTGKAEELMLTDQFLVFKDTLTHYLRNFIVVLQRTGGQLEAVLRETEADVWNRFVQKVVADEARLPSLEEMIPDEERFERHMEEWSIFVHWFTGKDMEQSDVVFLERATKDSIAKMVKAALAIQEKHRFGISRKRELDYLGQWFLRLDELTDAERLFAHTYGLYKTRHFQGEGERTSDSADMSMWDEVPIIRELRSRSRVHRKTGGTEAIRDRKEQQQKAKQAFLAEKSLENDILQKWLRLGTFKVSELERLTSLERKFLLFWISRCIANRSRTTRTPDGLEIVLQVPGDGKRAYLTCEDGTLEMPDFGFVVKEVSGK